MAKKLTAESRGELDSFFDNLQNNIEKVEPDNLQLVIQEFINKVKGNLRDNNLVASGKLEASIQPLPIEKEPGILKIKVELEDYWKKIEQGTKPLGFTKENRKKLQPKIAEWIKNKPSLQAKVAAEDRRSLSYAIATNILKKGTIKRFNYKGYPFLTKELDTFKKKILKAYEDGINNI